MMKNTLKDKITFKVFQDQNAAETSALIPADMAGSRMATTATSGAVKRKVGPKPKTSAKMKVDT